MAQVRPAPGNGGSTSLEIHRCYPVLELSGYLSWTISSIKLGSWSSWRKTLVNKIWILGGSIIRWTFSCDYVLLYTLWSRLDQYQRNTGWTSWEIGEPFGSFRLIFVKSNGGIWVGFWNSRCKWMVGTLIWWYFWREESWGDPSSAESFLVASDWFIKFDYFPHEVIL